MENNPDSIDGNAINRLEEINEQANNNSIPINGNEPNNQNQEQNPEQNPQINYFTIIRNYLNRVNRDEEYISKIKENPDLLFEKMNESRLIIWETFLYNISSPSRKNSDSDILCALLEREDQKVIRNDCKRTRVRESILVPGFPKILEAFLTHYCTSKEIHYKQGLNEVFGPLILLKYKFKNLKFSKIFDLGEVFIDQFLPNYFYEKDLYSLNSSLGLFLVLLRYHEPSVYNRLDVTEIKPEMYATNPLTTLMTGKLKLDLVYELMERIIKCQDPLIIHFILVALFIYQREMIINCDRTYVATLMTSLSITTMEELNTIFDMALKLREQTPYSYRILVNKIGFLKKNNKDIKKNYDLYQPQTIPAMPIFPLEIFSITSRDLVDCVDPECKNSKPNDNNIFNENNINEYDDLMPNENRISTGFLKFQEHLENHLCEKCDMKIEKKMQYILLDLRILKYDEEDNDTEKTGFLPKMINVDQDELKSEEFSKIITNRFLVERGNYHFIFLTSSTDTFSDFELKYYTDNLSELDRKKMMFGLIKQQKIDKELNLEDAQKDLTWKDIYKLKEYDNFRNTLKTMQKENFPYIGYVYGGFDEVHEESFKFNYELLFHNEQNCFLCQAKKLKRRKNRRKSKKEKDQEELIKTEISGSLWEHKIKIKYSKINEIYKGQNISLHFCILSKYKNKNYENDKIKVLITLLFDQYLMELYKFDTQKEYNDVVTNDDKEKKRKKSEYYDLGKESNEEKDTDLILFEKINVTDITSVNSNNKYKNIVNITVRERPKEKEKEKDKKKSKRPSINLFDIILDFSSANDSKQFINSFKKTISNFKEKNK